MTYLRVLVVDDNPDFVNTAVRMLGQDGRVAEVGSAVSGSEALVQVADFRPDLVLMDIAMPGMNGIEVTRRIKSLPAAPRVVMLTLHDDAEYRVAAESAGANGFIAKWELGTLLGPLIEELVAGP